MCTHLTGALLLSFYHCSTQLGMTVLGVCVLCGVCVYVLCVRDAAKLRVDGAPWMKSMSQMVSDKDAVWPLCCSTCMHAYLWSGGQQGCSRVTVLRCN